ncbi:Bax inhibitor-1/YccA family protein [Rubellimicrobium aerolatum]|uniref:Bax inhibitor-1 family protein n=1 Tax=Rubellimicrobium aerolatum TaxID=490979 RepID=A0ABW0SC42_9RHOB|nr:Bax inhibitor-1/YccA family protein [Rubellimicrobium aerolatum]MBP1806239.1 FtsH-binding integral membrane protein [Rubellimicrobium aerolatum]
MADYSTIRATTAGARAARIDEGLRAHMNKVYGTMSVGMLVTFAVAWAVGSSPALLSVFRDPATLQPNILGWIAMFAPLIFVFVIGGAVNRVSAAALQAMFYVFSALMGLSMAWIFAAFTGVSIAQTFLATSVAFGAMSLYGYTTKRDLGPLGAFLMIGVIGLLVVMIVNLFVQSSAMAFAISAIGVLIFAGLTAYDTQRIKVEYVQHASHGDSEWLGKSAILGALNLYMNFINIFMFLLQFMGSQRE